MRRLAGVFSSKRKQKKEQKEALRGTRTFKITRESYFRNFASFVRHNALVVLGDMEIHRRAPLFVFDGAQLLLAVRGCLWRLRLIS